MFFRYRPKGVFGKVVGNASKMRQKCFKVGLVYLEKRNVPKCVKIASKIRGTPLGENTFWTIPIFVSQNSPLHKLDSCLPLI